MANKSVFGKKGAMVAPVSSIKRIVRATAAKLKPIYADIIDDIVSKFVSYGPAAESLRVKEADFGVPDVGRIVDEYEDEIIAVLTPATLAAARMTANSVVKAFGSKYYAEFFNNSIKPVILARVFKIVTTEITPQIETSLKAKINTAISDGWALKKLEDSMTELKGNYATIARTEVLSAVSQAEHIQASHEISEFGLAGRTLKEWHISGSGKERDTHIEASIKYGEGNGIPYEENFILNKADGGTEEAFMPRDSGLSAGNFINCQCFMTIKVLPLGS